MMVYLLNSLSIDIYDTQSTNISQTALVEWHQLNEFNNEEES